MTSNLDLGLRFGRLTRTTLLILAAATVACGPASGPGNATRTPPVILISVDTLRADRLPAYGYDRVDTPAIDALAADGLVFEQAFSHAPLTLPAHASIFSGTLPPVHGARDNAGFTVGDDVPLLTETLRAAGYRTGAFVSAFPLRQETGLARGFDVYDAELEGAVGAGLGEIQRAGAATLARALSWLGTESEKPPFLFLHLFEPHLPYDPPADLAARYASPYDGEIAAADRLIGRLLGALRVRELYDDALVIFLSDHGEGLGDHGEDDHGLFLYASTLRVPLLVKLPHAARAGERVGAPAQLVDIVPTVRRALGLDPIEGAPGRPLQEIGDETRTPTVYAETWAPRLHFGWSELTAAIEYPYHYIEAPEPELYDLEVDPRELVNRIFELQEPARRLGARLATLGAPLENPVRLEPEVRERLAALGYVGGGNIDETLADPKSKIHVLQHLKAAAALFFEGRYAEAIAEYDAALREDPGVLAAWEFMGRSQLQLGRLDEAAHTFETLISLNGGRDPHQRLVLAELYLRQERLDEAARTARPALEEEPGRTRVLLAHVERARGRPEAARPLLQDAVQADPHNALAHAMLAEILLGAGESEAALTHVDRALALAAGESATGGLRVLRGRALLRLGRRGDASAAFIEEMERFPSNLQAYRQLALLHLTEGDPEVGQQVLESMLQANPGPQAEVWAIETLREAGHEEVAEAWRRRAAGRYPDGTFEEPVLRWGGPRRISEMQERETF